MKKLILILMLVSLSAFAKDLTLDNVKLEIEEQGLDCPLIVLAQSIEECGWRYESYNARNRNNIFGLWNSSKQKFFEFKGWRQSVTYYKGHIQNRHKRGEDYFHFLGRIGYATNPKYLSNVRIIHRKLKRMYENQDK